MNEDTLTIALGRMADAIEPPAAAERLITTRRARIRRRRHLTTGLVAASVLAIAATGGVVASNFGNAGHSPDGVPAASDGVAPANAVTEAEDAEKSGLHCTASDEGSMTAEEIESFKNQVLGNKKLHLDIDGNEVRAFLVLGNDSPLYSIDARRVGDEVEIVSVTRCEE